MDSLYAYTAGGAWAAYLDGLTGRLVVGLAADLVMIDGDIESVAVDQIGHMGIALTVVGGSITHQAL
jgi:predicted amidohydrolase YtcJ